MKEGLQRLKILWDIRRESEDKKMTAVIARPNLNASGVL